MDINKNINGCIYVDNILDIDFSKASKFCLTQGDYTIGNTLIIPKNCELVLERKTTIRITSNIIGIHLKWGSKISGGNLCVSISGYDKAALYVEGADGWNIKQTEIDSISINNDGFGGIGILYDDLTGGGVVYTRNTNLFIGSFEYGIKFISPMQKDGWANSNTFDTIVFYNCAISIGAYMNGCFMANYFKNISIQTYNNTFKSALEIQCDAQFNTIEFMSWDKADYVNSFTLGSRTRDNKIYAPLLENVGCYTDLGTNNYVDTFVKHKGSSNGGYELNLTNLNSDIQYPVIFNNYVNVLIYKEHGGIVPNTFSLKLESMPNGWGHYSPFYNVFVQSEREGNICSKIASEESSIATCVWLRGGSIYKIVDLSGNSEKARIITDSFTDNNFTVTPMNISDDLKSGNYAGTDILNIESKSKEKGFFGKW
ncbi:MAG: hypothetical protein ACRC57_03655 [Sarcina sp.]